ALVVAEAHLDAGEVAAVGDTLLLEQGVAAHVAHAALQRARPEGELALGLVVPGADADHHAVRGGGAVLAVRVVVAEVDEARRRGRDERAPAARERGERGGERDEPGGRDHIPSSLRSPSSCSHRPGRRTSLPTVSLCFASNVTVMVESEARSRRN